MGRISNVADDAHLFIGCGDWQPFTIRAPHVMRAALERRALAEGTDRSVIARRLMLKGAEVEGIDLRSL